LLLKLDQILAKKMARASEPRYVDHPSTELRDSNLLDSREGSEAYRNLGTGKPLSASRHTTPYENTSKDSSPFLLAKDADKLQKVQFLHANYQQDAAKPYDVDEDFFNQLKLGFHSRHERAQD
jgi:hypothetical protein